MKDVLFYILLYKLWNTPFHNEHITAVTVIFTLWVVINIIELIIEFIKK